MMQLFTSRARVDRNEYIASDGRPDHRFDEFGVIEHDQGKRIALHHPFVIKTASDALAVIPKLAITSSCVAQLLLIIAMYKCQHIQIGGMFHALAHRVSQRSG